MASKTTTLYDGFHRVGSFFDPTQSWTKCFWFRNSTTPGVAQYKVGWNFGDQAYINPYIFFGSVPNSDTYSLEAWDGSTAFDVSGPTILNHDEWTYVICRYDASATLLYLDVIIAGVNYSQGSLLVDFGTFTFVETDDYHLTDTQAGAGVQVAIALERTWQRFLLDAEVLAESNAIKAIITTNLLSDSPLPSGLFLNDYSGNARNWTLGGSITYIAGPISPNNSTLTPFVIPSLPFSFVQDAKVGATTQTLWYEYTAVIPDKVIGAWGFGDLTTYKPTGSVFTTATGTVGAVNVPFQVPLVVGTTYQFEFQPNGGNPNGVLIIDILRAPTDAIQAGNLFINDDTDGFPGAVIDHVTSDVRQFIWPFVAGENADVLDNGKMLFEDLTGFIRFYNFDFNLVKSTALTSIKCIRLNRTSEKFYVSRAPGAPTAATLRRFDNTGTDDGSLWTFTAQPGRVKGCASPDDTIFYYTQAGLAAAVKRWDLVNNVALTDLVAANGTHTITDMLGLDDGSIIVLYLKTSVTKNVMAIHYSAAGATLNTYDFGAIVGSTTPLLAYALDHPSSFWAFLHTLSPTGFTNLQNVRVSDGTILANLLSSEFEGGAFQPAETATPERFGNSFSCPLIVLRVAITKDSGTGLFKLVVINGNPLKTDDTYLDSVGASTDVAIPNPFIETYMAPGED